LALTACDLRAIIFPQSTLAHMVVLDLTSNQWMSPDLSPLKWLRKLVLRDNQLSELPDLSALIKLQWIDLSYNPLGKSLPSSSFPPSLTTTLRHLDLEATQLASLVDSSGVFILKSLTSLHHLNIAGNVFETAVAVLASLQCRHLPKLTHLTVAPNPFCISDDHYSDELMKTTKVLTCLEYLNGKPFQVQLGAVSTDSLAEALGRSLEGESAGGTRLESCSCIEVREEWYWPCSFWALIDWAIIHDSHNLSPSPTFCLLM